MMSEKSPRPHGAAEPFGFLSRRKLLKLAAGGGLLLASGGGGLYGLRGRAPEVEGLRVLSAHAYRTLSAIASVHIPKGGAFDLGAADFDLARLFDEYLAVEPPENVRNVKAALLLVEYGPLYKEGRLATFSNLSLEERAAHWDSWNVSKRQSERQIALAFRKFLSFVFYDQESVWTHIGYSGPSAKALFS